LTYLTLHCSFRLLSLFLGTFTLFSPEFREEGISEKPATGGSIIFPYFHYVGP
jgi:hypothetical protein